jgi:hypothetical protein
MDLDGWTYQECLVRVIPALRCLPVTENSLTVWSPLVSREHAVEGSFNALESFPPHVCNLKLGICVTGTGS